MTYLIQFLFLLFISNLVIDAQPTNGHGRGRQPKLINPLVKKLVDFVEENGLELEGLYRVSGNSQSVKNLAQDCIFLDANLTKYRVPDVTSFLKEILRNLTISFIDNETFGKLLLASNITNKSDNEKKEENKRILLHLPKDVLHNLVFIMQHLQKVAEHQDNNKMTPRNIAVIFAPTLLNFFQHGNTDTRELIDQKIQVVEHLLNLPSSFWTELISDDSTVTTVNRASLNRDINDVVRRLSRPLLNAPESEESQAENAPESEESQAENAPELEESQAEDSLQSDDTVDDSDVVMREKSNSEEESSQSNGRRFGRKMSYKIDPMEELP